MRLHTSVFLWRQQKCFLDVCSGPVLARQQLATRRRAFTYLGVSLASAKVEGPAHVLTFIGVILDTRALTSVCRWTNLPSFTTSYGPLSTTASTTQCQLEYLLGKLSFATRVIVPGRTLQIVVTCQLVPAAVLPDQALRRVPQISSLMA